MYPGTYTARLKVEGQSYTQPITILRDPRSPGSNEDIGSSVKTLLRIRDDITCVSDTVNGIEWLRKQLEVIETMLRPPKEKEKEKPLVTDDEEDFAEPEPALELAPDDAAAKRKADLLKTVEAMDLKLQSIEYKLVSPALVNSDDKYYVEAYRVYFNLIWLNAEVGTGGGDVAGGADFAPTDTQLELLQTLEAEMAAPIADYQKLIDNDLPVFNHSLSANHVTHLVPVSNLESKARD